MSVEVLREFRGAFELVGSFTETLDGSWQFAYAQDYLTAPQSHALSNSLPLREESYARDDYQGFFEGMLPESALRSDLSRQFHLAPSDFVGLLDKLGSECVGAIQFRNVEEAKEPLRYLPFTREDVASLRNVPKELSRQLVSATRLSLAGAQTKFGVYIPNGACTDDPHLWHKPLNTAPSTHIVKVSDEQLSSLPYNELACMTLAQELGLPSVELAVPQEFPHVLVARRYDRAFGSENVVIDGLPAPRRLHQEDFCQALGWAPYLKYEITGLAYARLAGKLIARISTDAIADRSFFATRILFDYLVGNCDSHLKNHSFLYSEGWSEKRLAPVYDVVSTTMLGFERKMSFTIGEHIAIDEIELVDWDGFADDIALPRREMSQIIEHILEFLPVAIEGAASHLPTRGKEQLELLVSDMKPRMCKLQGGK